MVTANADVTGPFETTEFEYSRNSMAGSFDFRALEGRLIKIKEALLEEHSGWIRQGEAATAKGAHSYDCQQIQMALQVGADESGRVSDFRPFARSLHFPLLGTILTALTHSSSLIRGLYFTYS